MDRNGIQELEISKLMRKTESDSLLLRDETGMLLVAHDASLFDPMSISEHDCALDDELSELRTSISDMHAKIGARRNSLDKVATEKDDQTQSASLEQVLLLCSLPLSFTPSRCISAASWLLGLTG